MRRLTTEASFLLLPIYNFALHGHHYSHFGAFPFSIFVWLCPRFVLYRACLSYCQLAPSLYIPERSLLKSCSLSSRPRHPVARSSLIFCFLRHGSRLFERLLSLLCSGCQIITSTSTVRSRSPLVLRPNCFIVLSLLLDHTHCHRVFAAFFS